MPAPPTTSAVWGAEQWSATLIEAITLQSALLRSGASRTTTDARVVHIPRLKVNPAAAWVAELTPIPSDGGDADTLVLTPRKVGNALNLSNESIEDASIDALNAVGNAMTRGVATRVDAAAFSNAAATATTPAGLLSCTLPGSGTGGTIDIDHILDGVGAIQSHGGMPDTVFANPIDITAIRKLKSTQGVYLLAPDAVSSRARPRDESAGVRCCRRRD